MIELKVLNPHWLESFEEPEYDLCVHSPVRLKIGEKVFSDEGSGSWTVSAAAYEFLRTLQEDHDSEENEQLLPCCGFNFWKIEDRIVFGNCGTGLNWDIRHRNDKIVHKFDDDEETEVSLDQWRDAVVKFTDDVLDFYKNSAPRKFSDDEGKEDFEFFINELKRLRKEAFELNV